MQQKGRFEESRQLREVLFCFLEIIFTKFSFCYKYVTKYRIYTSKIHPQESPHNRFPFPQICIPEDFMMGDSYVCQTTFPNPQVPEQTELSWKLLYIPLFLFFSLFLSSGKRDTNFKNVLLLQRST